METRSGEGGAVVPGIVGTPQWNGLLEQRPGQQEFWLYRSPGWPAGLQELWVCGRDGYDFAHLVWQVCEPCRRAVVRKIRVTDRWQRRGYGIRMLRRAVTGLESYTWWTTPPMEDGRVFFPVAGPALQVEFRTGRPWKCAHMSRRSGPAGTAGNSSSRQLEEPPV